MKNKTTLYLAPMEGITTYVYRNAQAAVYGRLDKYFTPFLEPHEKRSFKKRELKEVLPENNRGLFVVPQILTNQAEGFLELASALVDFGYEEINLNLGCPSGTVANKGKGSGFLAHPEELDRFFDRVFSGLEAVKPGLRVSVKTRLGFESPEEFPALLQIFNRYPLEELIVHARVRQDFYKKEPRLSAFELAQRESRAPVCYNGDLFTRTHIERFQKRFPETERLMIGRGLLVNPGLALELREAEGIQTVKVRAGNVQIQKTAENAAEDQEKKERFRRFHQMVLDGYKDWDMGGRNVLFKMKELWFYQIWQFEDAEKFAKKIKKAQTLQEYEEIVERLFQEKRMVSV